MSPFYRGGYWLPLALFKAYLTSLTVFFVRLGGKSESYSGCNVIASLCKQLLDLLRHNLADISCTYPTVPRTWLYGSFSTLRDLCSDLRHCPLPRDPVIPSASRHTTAMLLQRSSLMTQPLALLHGMAVE